MKTLQERIKLLQEAGVDTSKYELKLEGITLKSDDNTVISIVGNQQVNNQKLFRRWITAQTFKMLYEGSYNRNTRTWEYGWDTYLKNKYDYMYQFKMMLEELRILSKLEVKDKEEFVERSQFFTKKVVVSTCRHYINQLFKYINKHEDYRGFVNLAKYGQVKSIDVNKLFINDLRTIIDDIKYADTYAEMYSFLKAFMRKMNKLPDDTPKCPLWKDAFKGSGAYYSLKNMILFHNVVVRGYTSKDSSINYLKEYKRTLSNGDLWRLHQLLKDTIEYNNFDLRKSI